MSLLPHHAEMLARSAISGAVARERGYYSVEQKRDLEQLGFGRAQQRVKTLVVPVYSVVNGEAPWYMHRPDQPRHKDGREVKYEIPRGRTMALDIHPRARGHLGDPKIPLFTTEGSKKVDALITAGAKAVVGLVGVWSWRGSNNDGGKAMLPDWEFVALNDRQVFVVFDSDVMLKEPVRLAMERLGAALNRRGAHVAYCYLPSTRDGAKQGADDFLAAGNGLPDIVALATTTLRRPISTADPKERRTLKDVKPVTLTNAVNTYQKWLYLPDPEPLYVLWGAIAANRLPGDPVWMLLVGASGGGKTEMVRACNGLPECSQISTLSEAGLLSGTPRVERSEDATGGVLRQLGSQGIIVAKDFTSVLAMEKDSRGKVLAALREVYDGEWSRPLGADGGRTLHWSGKVGLVGGVTYEIDRQHIVMARMGERLLLYRLPRGQEAPAVDRAMSNSRRLEQMREALRDAALGVFAGLGDRTPRAGTEEEKKLIKRIAGFVARARAGVYRDYRGDVDSMIVPEVPTRLAMQLVALLGGMDVIGVDRETALLAVINTAVGCIPNLRREVLDELLGTDAEMRTKAVAVALDHPTRSVRRALEDLTVHGLVSREARGGNEGDGWSLRPEVRVLLDDLTSTSMHIWGSGISGSQDEDRCVPDIPGPPIPTDVDDSETVADLTDEELLEAFPGAAITEAPAS